MGLGASATASPSLQPRGTAPKRRVTANAAPLQSRELVALGLHDVRGRLGDEPLVGELALGAGDLALEPARRSRPARRLGLGVDRVGGQHGDAAARHADAWRPARRRRASTRRVRAARRARPSPRSPRPPAARARPRRAPRRRGRASRAAPARPRSRAPAAPRRPRRRSAGVAPRASGARHQQPSAPGTCDQISSVTNGITGCASASVSPSTCSAQLARAASLSSA